MTATALPRIILVGRHAPTGLAEKFEIVEQKAINFPSTADACRDALNRLVAEANAASALLIFQAVPGQLAIALADLKEEWTMEENVWGKLEDPAPRVAAASRSMEPVRSGIGIVISTPGPRPGKVSRMFILDDPMTGENATIHMVATAQAIARFANPKAEAFSSSPGFVTVEVDGPPMSFNYSHIEWL